MTAAVLPSIGRGLPVEDWRPLRPPFHFTNLRPIRLTQPRQVAKNQNPLRKIGGGWTCSAMPGIRLSAPLVSALGRNSCRTDPRKWVREPTTADEFSRAKTPTSGSSSAESGAHSGKGQNLFTGSRNGIRKRRFAHAWTYLRPGSEPQTSPDGILTDNSNVRGGWSENCSRKSGWAG